jgi:hypothetical protein
LKQKKEALFAIRVKKYLKRKASYDRIVQKMIHGRLTFRRVKNTKDLSFNPYTRTVTTYIPPVGSFNGFKPTETYTSGGWNYWRDKMGGEYTTGQFVNGHLGVFYSPVFAVPDIASRNSAISSADTRALNTLYERAGEQSVHVGNLIAERHQTLSLFDDIVKRISKIRPKKFVKDIVHMLTYPKGHRLRNAADDYLAFMFGVKPLLADAFSAGEALAKYVVDGSQQRIIVRAQGKGTSSGSKVTIGLSNGKPYYTDTIALTTEVKIRYLLEFKIDNGALHALQGLGLVNPAEIAWEMLPWSFVIDWFLPIGNYINSFSSTAGLVFLRGTKSTTTIDQYTATRQFVGNPYEQGGSVYNGYSGTGVSHKRIETKTRDILTGMPKNRFPVFKSPLSAYHISESLALMVQRWTSARPRR